MSYDLDTDLDVDTTRYLDTTVSSHYAGPGPGVCGCNPTYGQSCPRCDGGGYGAASSAWTYEGWVQVMREKTAREAGGAA
jgi:hypothetical protein